MCKELPELAESSADSGPGSGYGGGSSRGGYGGGSRDYDRGGSRSGNGGGWSGGGDAWAFNGPNFGKSSRAGGLPDPRTSHGRGKRSYNSMSDFTNQPTASSTPKSHAWQSSSNCRDSANMYAQGMGRGGAACADPMMTFDFAQQA